MSTCIRMCVFFNYSSAINLIMLLLCSGSKTCWEYSISLTSLHNAYSYERRVILPLQQQEQQRRVAEKLHDFQIDKILKTRSHVWPLIFRIQN